MMPVAKNLLLVLFKIDSYWVIINSPHPLCLLLLTLALITPSLRASRGKRRWTCVMSAIVVSVIMCASLVTCCPLFTSLMPLMCWILLRKCGDWGCVSASVGIWCGECVRRTIVILYWLRLIQVSYRCLHKGGWSRIQAWFCSMLRLLRLLSIIGLVRSKRVNMQSFIVVRLIVGGGFCYKNWIYLIFFTN